MQEEQIEPMNIIDLRREFLRYNKCLMLRSIQQLLQHLLPKSLLFHQTDILFETLTMVGKNIKFVEQSVL